MIYSKQHRLTPSVLNRLIHPHRRSHIFEISLERQRFPSDIRRLDSIYIFCTRHAHYQLHRQIPSRGG